MKLADRNRKSNKVFCDNVELLIDLVSNYHTDIRRSYQYIHFII